MKLKEIAEALNKHIQTPGKLGNRRIYDPKVYAAGRFVMLKYVSYQGTWSISKTEAEQYLAWLDSGNSGDHWQFKRETANAAPTLDR